MSNDWIVPAADTIAVKPAATKSVDSIINPPTAPIFKLEKSSS